MIIGFSKPILDVTKDPEKLDLVKEEIVSSRNSRDVSVDDPCILVFIAPSCWIETSVT